jgi:hypothetical protein
VRPPWWAALPAVETRIRCGTGEHVLRWSEGRLTAADHPDAEGELVLAALGGDKAACVAMLEAWGAHGDDLEVLALGPRSPADELAVTWELVDELRTVSGRRAGSVPMRPGPAPGGGSATFSALSYSAPSRGARPAARVVRGMPMRRFTPEQERALARRTELLSLFALGRDFQARLSAQVVSAWSGAGTSAGPRELGRARPALVAALTGRLAPAAGPWAGLDPDEVRATLHEDPGWGSAERDGPGLRAALPLSWLARVWAAGFPVVGGHLVVDVLAGSWPRVQVLGLLAPGAEPAVLSIQADGEHWSLARGES